MCVCVCVCVCVCACVCVYEVECKRQFMSWGGRAVSANRYSNKTARLAHTHIHNGHTRDAHTDILFTFGPI